MCVPSARFNQLQITLAITLFLIRTHGAFTSPCFASCPMRICLVPELYVIGLILLMCNWKTRFKHFRHLHRMLVFTIKKRKRKKRSTFQVSSQLEVERQYLSGQKIRFLPPVGFVNGVKSRNYSFHMFSWGTSVVNDFLSSGFWVSAVSLKFLDKRKW